MSVKQRPLSISTGKTPKAARSVKASLPATPANPVKPVKPATAGNVTKAPAAPREPTAPPEPAATASEVPGPGPGRAPARAARPAPAATPRPPKRPGSAAAPARAEPAGGLDAALSVLRQAGSPMRVRAISEAVIKQGLWSPGGRTPWATLSAAMGREIRLKGRAARFRKAERGLFAAAPEGPGK